MARSKFGLEVQVLHELGYKLADNQRELTREQKLFLIESRRHFKEKIKGDKKTGGKKGLKSHTQELRSAFK